MTMVVAKGHVMAGRQRKSLESWLHDALTDPDKEGPCTQLSLVHMVGTAEREVHSRGIAPGLNVTDVATMFKGKAEAYGQDLSGAQLFCMLAFYGGSKEVGARFPFSVAGDFGVDGTAMATFSPDARGEKAMGMQYLQAGLGMVFNQTRALFEAAERSIERISAREERLARENADAYAIVHKVMMDKITEDHAMRMKELEYERSSTERRQLMKMAPALANTAFGTEIFPQSSADSALIEALAEALAKNPNVDIKQMAMMLGLPAEMTGLLVARLTEVAKNAREERENALNARKALSTSTPDDELQ